MPGSLSLVATSGRVAGLSAALEATLGGDGCVDPTTWGGHAGRVWLRQAERARCLGGGARCPRCTCVTGQGPGDRECRHCASGRCWLQETTDYLGRPVRPDMPTWRRLRGEEDDHA